MLTGRYVEWFLLFLCAAGSVVEVGVIVWVLGQREIWGPPSRPRPPRERSEGGASKSTATQENVANRGKSNARGPKCLIRD